VADQIRPLVWDDLFNDQTSSLTKSAALPFDFSTEFAESIQRIERLPVPYLNVFHTRTRFGILGEGSSTRADEALRTSIFEAFERYSAGIYEGAFIRGSYNVLQPKAVDPRELVLLTDEEYSKSQNSYVRYDDNLSLHWVPCFEIGERFLAERFVPAALAILRYGWAHRDERIAPILSSGSASGETLAQAILHAQYELVERDAFLIAWLKKRPVPQLQVSSFNSPDLAASLAQLRTDQFQIRFADLTTDLGIPAYLVAISHPLHPDGATVFGLGANQSPNRALERAYIEAIELLVNFFNFSDNTIRPRCVKSLAGLPPAEYFRRCQFLFSTACGEAKQRQEPNTFTTQDEMNSCLRLLKEHGLRTYFVDLTPQNLSREIQYKLVRVFVSWLQPHVYELDAWRLANPRLSTSDAENLNLLKDPFAAAEFAEWV
jgi:thiazole/oxazole-forming peptide maturase SagD family component